MAKSTDERFTPEHVLDVVREFFGGSIGLDPCTTADNPTRAQQWFTRDTDGLSQDWIGAYVWCNPPYSRGSLREWTEHVIKCSEGGYAEVLMLVPSDLGSSAGKRIAQHASGLCFVSGRLTFQGPNLHTPSAGAKQPSIIAYFGERQGRFKRVFEQLGAVWIR